MKIRRIDEAGRWPAMAMMRKPRALYDSLALGWYESGRWPDAGSGWHYWWASGYSEICLSRIWHGLLLSAQARKPSNTHYARLKDGQGEGTLPSKPHRAETLGPLVQGYVKYQLS